MKTITWNDFCLLLSQVDAIQFNDCIIYSPIDEDGSVTMVINDYDMNQETLTFNEADNSSIHVRVGGCLTLKDDDGLYHTMSALKTVDPLKLLHELS